MACNFSKNVALPQMLKQILTWFFTTIQFFKQTLDVDIDCTWSTANYLAIFGIARIRMNHYNCKRVTIIVNYILEI